jgi:histidinol-phosphate aminotransferase
MTIQFADHLKDIPDYVPGKPVEELERELGIREAIIKMASN